MLNEFLAAVKSDNRRKLRKAYAFNRDLREQIHRDTRTAIKQTRGIAQRFRGYSITDTCERIHNFLRKNIVYLRDRPDLQQIQLPSRFLKRLTGDCKSYSVFIYAILHNLEVPGCLYKYASYPDLLTGKASKVPGHIYVVCEDEARQPICMDGTNPKFNQELSAAYSFTCDPMRVETLSGGNDALAAEVLAGEVLSSEAASKFFARFKKMGAAKTRRYLKQFTPTNRNKILRSIRSLHKERQLNDEGTYGMGGVGGVAGLSDEEINGKKYINGEALAGKKFKQRRAKKLAKRAAKAKPGSNKQKRLATKAKIKAAKASGDKKALKAARKERRERIKENAKKVGKFVAKINPVLAVGRGAYLGLVALNVRGFATNLAEIIKAKAEGPVKKKWEAIGGKWGRLVKVINKGKNKKALFGKKGVGDEVLAGALAVEPATGTAIAAASSVIGILTPIIGGVLKKLGKPEAAAAIEATGKAAKLVAGKTDAGGTSKVAAFTEKVESFIDNNPAIEAAVTSGKDTYTAKLEKIGEQGTKSALDVETANPENFDEDDDGETPGEIVPGKKPHVGTRDEYEADLKNLSDAEFEDKYNRPKKPTVGERGDEKKSSALPWLLGAGLAAKFLFL